MVSVKAELSKTTFEKTLTPIAAIQESDIAAVFDPDVATTARPKYRDFIDSLKFDYDLRLRLFGYGIDDQSSPRLHPFFDAAGSIPTKVGGRDYSRDKKYTAGASINGIVDFKPKAGSPMTICDCRVETDSTRATTGALTISKFNSATKALAQWQIDSAFAASQFLGFPSPGTVAGSNDNTNDTTTWPRVVSPDFLRIRLDSMANAEIFRIRLRALIHGPDDPPDPTVVANLTEAAE